MIKAMLFDFDGTLADTNPLIIRTFNETFAELSPGHGLTEPDILELIGPTLHETGLKYFPADPDGFSNRYREINLLYHDDMIEVYPGVGPMLAALKGMGLKMAIVSSKKRDMVLRGLKLLDLEQYFDWVLGGDDVTHPKPHREPIDRVLAYYGLQPAECLMVGDNSHDIDSAKNAGVKSIAVGWAYKGAEYLKKYAPDYIINTGDELIQIVQELNGALPDSAGAAQ